MISGRGHIASGWGLGNTARAAGCGFWLAFLLLLRGETIAAPSRVQRPGQRAIAAPKIENGIDSDLGKPISNPIMHISDHGVPLGGLLVGSEPFRIMIEISSESPG
jgi:hypothetical protein